MGRIKTFAQTRTWLSLSLAFLLGATIAAAGTQTRVSDVESDLTAAESLLGDQRSRADDLESEMGDLHDEITDVEAELSETVDEADDLRDERDELKHQVAALRSKRPIPNLVGKQEGAAEKLESAFGWSLSINKQGSEKSPGTILAQSPSAGTQMKYGATMTVTVAKPLPPGWKDVKVFSGSGSMNTSTFKLTRQKSRIVYSFSGGTNASMVLYEAPRNYTDLLLNEIGTMSGSTRLYYTGTYWLEICCGSWTVRVQEWR